MNSEHRRRRRGRLLLAAAAAIAVAGCSEPQLPLRDNPLDPAGIYSYHPGVELLSGPTGDAIISGTDVTYRWRGTGHAEAFNWKLDGADWHGWTTQDSAAYRFLDEGRHRFTVCATAQYGTPEPQKECTFIVHSLASPALLAYPWHCQAGTDTFISVQLLVSQLGHLSKARFVMAYDSTALRFSAIYLHPGCWPSPATYDSSRPGLVDITVRQGSGGSGTANDTLALLMLTPRTLHGLDSLSFTGATQLWDINGNPVSLAAVRGCWIASGR